MKPYFSHHLFSSHTKSMIDVIYQSWVEFLRHLCLLALPILILMASTAKATDSFGQASDIFHVGAGARALGMGGAFTAVSDDASAPYYNPAGLAYLDEHQLMAMYAPLMMDSNYNFIGSAHPFGDQWGTVALSDVLLMSNNFEVRDDFNTKTGDDSIRNNAIYGSYARKFLRNMAGGINLKMIQQKVASYSGSTLGVDVGFMYRPSPLFVVGYAMENVNAPKVKLDSEEDTYRPLNRLGVASEVFKDKLLLSVDAIKVNKGDALYSAGLEYTVTRLFQFRAGYGADRSYTFGMGIKINPFRVDYAFSNTDLGAFNKVSFTWAWHNIYQTEIDPPMKEGRAIYPLSGFENQVAFKTAVPNQTVARWTLSIKNTEGQDVRKLEADLRPPETVIWDAKNAVGEPVVAGLYNYTFEVKYKNGKVWTINGNLDLALPNNKLENVIDMNLDINGARATEDAIK